MRRFIPLLILVIGIAALFVDLVPNLVLPQITNPSNNKALETKLGLDLIGGAQIEYKANPPAGTQVTPDQMNVIKSIMEQRVNAQGVSEPIIETQGNDRVVVQLPGKSGTEDFNNIRALVGKTGLLTFVPLPRATYGYFNASTGAQVQGTKPLPSDGANWDFGAEGLQALFKGDQVDGSGVLVGLDQTTGQYTVNFKLKSDAAQKFANWSGQNVGSYFAIVLGDTDTRGEVKSIPYIKEAIKDGSGQISGSFTQTSAQQLVDTIKYGALPFPVQEIGSSQIPATLGDQFLRQTLLAGGIGILLVMLFMLIYYRLPGAIADFALIYYSLVVLAIFRLFPVTLTLAGIAGFVLSIGMAVDANILIFERTKEELRVGKTLPAAIEAGFNRAWNSILDSNVSSLITASILYLLGSSTIKGFALVLIIGVLCSMFSAVTVSRTLLRGVVQVHSLRRAWLYGVTDEEFQARSVVPGRAARREATSRV